MDDKDQAARRPRKNLPAPQQQLIATARNDITIPYFTDTLKPVDDTLLQRGEGKGLKLYDEVERDTHAHAVLQKRRLALIAREWRIEPASDDPRDLRAAEMVEEQLLRLPFDRICMDLLDATLKGYAVSEIVWTRDGSLVRPDAVVTHDPRRFVFDVDWRPRLLTMAAPTKGEELPERKFIVHRFGVKGNNPYGLGLGSKLFWPVLFKREGVAFWLTFLEKFASPTPVGKYPQGTLPADQMKLLRALVDMKQEGAVVVPLGSELSMLEAQRAGQAGYEAWCRYWDSQISLCVFGSTLATQMEGQGSRAAAETHKEGEEQIVDADADLLSDTLQDTLLRWLVDYNLPGAGTPRLRRVRPKNELGHAELRLKRRAAADADLKALFDLAARVGPARFAAVAEQLAGAELMPDAPADLLRGLAPALAGAGPTPAANDDLLAGARRQEAFAGDGGADAHDHGMDALAAQLGAAAEPAIEAWLARVRTELDAALADGRDAAAFAERLLAIAPELTLDPLGRAIAPAVAVAELTGRADVQDEQAARRSGR